MNQLVYALVVVAMISGCGSKQKQESAPQQDNGLSLNLTPGGAPARVIPQEEAEEEESKPSSDMSVTLVPAGGKKKHAIEIDESKIMAPTGPIYPDSDSNDNHVADVQVKMGIHGEEHGGVDPIKAMRWLRNGNSRFTRKSLRADGQSAKDVARLAGGQKPHAIVLSCSDSRVPPELVFDQKLGEIFVVRTAGESLDPNVIGSIEYAVEHLGPRLLVVMGHTSCGAVRAAVDTLNGGDAGSASLNHLVADIHPRIRSEASQGASKDLHAESWANARGVAKDLLERSAIIKKAVQSGKLVITSSLYDTTSGRVDFE